MLALLLATPPPRRDAPLHVLPTHPSWPTHPLDYVSRWNATTEANYPNKFVSGTCNSALLAGTKVGEVVHTTRTPAGLAYAQVPAGKEGEMRAAVARGPVINAVLVDNGYAYYGGGVYDGIDPATGQLCSNTSGVNHGVLLVVSACACGRRDAGSCAVTCARPLALLYSPQSLLPMQESPCWARAAH